MCMCISVCALNTYYRLLSLEVLTAILFPPPVEAVPGLKGTETIEPKGPRRRALQPFHQVCCGFCCFNRAKPIFAFTGLRPSPMRLQGPDFYLLISFAATPLKQIQLPEESW